MDLFGEELTDLAAFQTQLKESDKNSAKAGLLREQLNKSKHELDSLEQDNYQSFQKFTGTEKIPPDKWKEKATVWRKERRELETNVAEIEKQLVMLGVPEECFPSKVVKTNWDAKKADSVVKRIDAIKTLIRRKEDEQRQLHAALATATSQSVTDTWETLLAGLEKKRDEISDNYKAITAEIIGKICVGEA